MLRRGFASGRMGLLASLLVLLLLLTACPGDDEPEEAAEPPPADPEDPEDPEVEEPADPEAEGVDLQWSYAFFAPAGTFPGRQMERWAELVTERTNGQVQVETFPGGTLLAAPDIYDGVIQGVADIGLGSPGYDVGRFPLLSGVALPVGFPNATVASLVMHDLMEEFEPEELTNDFKIITVFTTEPGFIQTIEPVQTLDDLSGLTLRGAGGGLDVLAALGADPVGMPMPEVPEAVQTGVIEGYLTSREVLQDFGLAEQIRYVTDYPTVVVTFAAVMRQSDWDELPSDIQGVIEELSREMTLWTGEYHDQENVGGALEWAEQEHGLEVIELDDGESARWDERLEPLVEQWVSEVEGMGLPAREFLDRLYELRDEYIEEHG
jgi:TRAP-type transport system periplasmic protein